ncbi:DNA-binding protein [Alcanivorax sp.]|uniref:DNA-binding protein n=1 Tax=Alcanivorax sp. TaxID=1872427 RepID=UPI0025C67D0E|nr:DNA-binding protein [Alcanivorax sp.]
MARAGVTYYDIVKAAETIKAGDQEPTVDRVREQLGTGSRSTIAPLLKRWRSDNDGAAEVSGLPRDLVEVVKSLHERMQQMADQRIDQIRQEFDALNDERHKRLTEANTSIVQLTARLQDMGVQLELLNEEKRQQSRSLEDTRVALAKAESQRDEAIARSTELKKTVTELKQENRDIRDHFEHYQQRTAADRQQEREQFRSASQGLKDQIQDLQHRLAQAESRSSDLFGANAQLRQRVHELEQANAALNSELSRKTEDIRNLKRDLEKALAKSGEYQSKNEQLAEKIAALTSQKAYLDKEVAVLYQALEATKTELKTTQDKVALLTDENKVILQEKAVIQGQFKQLQNSL